MILRKKRFKRHIKSLFFRKQRNNFNSLAKYSTLKGIFAAVTDFKETKRTWDTSYCVLYLCFYVRADWA